MGRRPPGLRRDGRRRAHRGRRRQRLRRLLRWATPAPWPATRRRRRSPPCSAGSASGRRDADAAHRGRGLGRRGARPALRRAAVELRADGDRRQPLGAAAVPRRSRGRPYVLVFNYCYHGSVDETVRRRSTAAGRARARATSARAVDPTQTTRVVRVQRPRRRSSALLADGRGRLRAGRAGADQHRHRPARARLPRRRCAPPATRTGTLLIIDETHTISAGPGRLHRRLGAAARPRDDRQGDRRRHPDRRLRPQRRGGRAGRGRSRTPTSIDVGGVGGTLAGNALSLAAARATLGEVLTTAAFAAMIALCDRFVAGVRDVIAERGVPWSIVQLGARAELCFAPEPPRTGGAERGAARRGARGRTCTSSCSTAAC